MSNPLVAVGIDMAKDTFVAALLTRGNRGASQSFSNDDAGYAGLLSWLSSQCVKQLSNPAWNRPMSMVRD
jgi:hypothetical protein